MISFSRIRTICIKELLVLLANRQSRVMLIVPPIMQIIIFAWAATMEVRNVDIAVLNDDAGRWSREIVRRVEGPPTFRHILYLRSAGDLRPALDNRRVMAVLRFDSRFSRDIENGTPARVQILLDGRRSNAAQILANYLNSIIADVAAITPAASLSSATASNFSPAASHGASSPPMPSAAVSPASREPQLALSTRFWFNPNLEFRWFFLPNLIGMVSFVLSIVITGLSVAREREMGTFDQILVSPATPTEIAIAKLLPGGLIGIFHATVFLLLIRFGFGVPMAGSVLLFYTAMALFTLASSAMGLMISSLCATQQQAFLGAFALAVPCILISGTITPISNMPIFLQWLSALTPVSHFLLLIQGVFLKDISSGAALLCAIRIALIACVCSVVAVWMFKRNRQ